MAPITKDFLKSTGLFCLFLSLQLIIPILALALSQAQIFNGAQFTIPGIQDNLLAITIPAMAFSFFVVQLARDGQKSNSSVGSLLTLVFRECPSFTL